MEPGEYEVFNFVLMTRSGILYTAKEDFSKTFIVKEGEIIYIGEYWFASTKKKDILGMTSLRFYITLSDQSGRDIPLAIKKEPTIREDRLKVQISDGERIVN